MNIHEYQAKQVLAKYGVAVPRGKEAFTVDEAVAAAKELNSAVTVVKAQIHAGGRGKAGGVKLAKSIDEVKQYAEEILGKVLVTHQTGPEGKEVRRLYIEEGSDIKQELYLGAVVDRDTSKVSFIASAEGGMEIEEVAASNPEKILTVTVDPATGILPYHVRKIAFFLDLEKELHKPFGKYVAALYQAFVDTDASQLEINPLVITGANEFVTLDAKFNFDDNALYRHPDLVELRDEDEEDPLERQAHDYDLAYVKMDGNIGCMVNGAGLAMATMDIIKYYGGEPANFLDVGGGANKEKVTTAFKLILSDPNVEGILVNIFGGIMRCDVIAEGVIAAAKEVNIAVPLVVRLEGTNVEQGKELLNNSGLAIIAASDLGDAADKIVAAVKQVKAA